MAQILAQVGLGISIFIVLAYLVTKYLASKTHPTPEKKEVLTPINENFSKQIEQELFNIEEREVKDIVVNHHSEFVEVPVKKSKSEFPIETPKKKRKYYPKKKK